MGRIEIFPSYDAQYETFSAVLDRAYRQSLDKKSGGWTICVDEGFEFKRLKLMGDLEKIVTQGRSLGMTMVTCAQRPVWLSRFILSEPKHKISFSAEGRDMKVLRECVGEGHYRAMQELQEFEFAWTYGPPGSRRTWKGNLQDLQ